MARIGNLICLTARDSYVVDEPDRTRTPLRRLERRMGAFVRSPGIAFPYLIGFLRKNGVLTADTHVAVQHDKLEGPTPFETILKDKVDLRRGDHDVLFITAYTNSVREAYRRAREARAAYAAAGRSLTVVLGGPHASAVPEEGTQRGHVDATVVGEGEWAASSLLNDIKNDRPVNPVYRATFDRIRDRGTLALDMSIWDGLQPRPHQIVTSTTMARGCKLDCHFCAVFLTNGPTVRNRDLADVVDEIRMQGPACTRETIHGIGSGFYQALLKGLVRTPLLGARFGERLIARMGPGFTEKIFFWDDNLYNAAGSFRALCEAIRPLGRTWAAELTIDLARKPDLLKLAYESGCRELFLGIESVSQTAIDGLDKWSNEADSMKEMVQRIQAAGIQVMGSFVLGLEGDDPSIFDRTLEFIQDSKIDYVVANIIQPYPGTGTFRDAVAGREFLHWAACPEDADVGMDYNWPLFDGAHVLLRPSRMTVDQLQEGYYYFLQQAYSLTGMLRRSPGRAYDVPAAVSHVARNYFLSRHGLSKTAHALARKSERRGAAHVVPAVRSQPGRSTAGPLRREPARDTPESG